MKRLVSVCFFLTVSGCASQQTMPDVPDMPDIVQHYLDLAQTNCARYAPSYAAPFDVKQAVKYVQFSNHPYQYIIVDGKYLTCPGCASCFHTQEGYDLKVFIGTSEDNWKLGFNHMVLKYELLDIVGVRVDKSPEAEESVGGKKAHREVDTPGKILVVAQAQAGDKHNPLDKKRLVVVKVCRANPGSL